MVITLAYLAPQEAQYTPVILMSKSAMDTRRDLAVSSGGTANVATSKYSEFSGCATRGFRTSVVVPESVRPDAFRQLCPHNPG